MKDKIKLRLLLYPVIIIGFMVDFVLLAGFSYFCTWLFATVIQTAIGKDAIFLAACISFALSYQVRDRKS